MSNHGLALLWLALPCLVTACAAPGSGPKLLRPAGVRAQGAGPQPVRFVPQAGHTGLIQYVGLSADGATAMSAGEVVKIWDTKTGAVLRTLGWSGGSTDLTAKSGSLGITGAALSPDARFVAFAASFTLQLMDLETGEEVARYKSASEGWWWTSLAFSPDGKLLAASVHKRIELIDVERWQVVRTIDNDSAWDQAKPVVFSRDGRWLRAGDLTWDAQTGNAAPPGSFPQGPRDGDREHAFSQDGQRVFGLTNTGALELRDVASSALVQSFRGKSDAHKAQALFSPDGRLIYESAVNRGTRVWDIANGMLARTFPAHEVPMALSPDGRRLVANRGVFGGPEVLDVETGAVLVKLAPTKAEGSRRWLAFAPDGTILRVTGRDDAAREGQQFAGTTFFEAFDGKTGALLRSASLEGEPRTSSVQFAPDAGTVLLTQWHRFSVWDLQRFVALKGLDAEEVNSLGAPVTFLGDGRRAVSLGHSHDPRNPAEFFFWDLEAGRRTRSVMTTLSTSPVMVVNPIGRRALVGSDGGLITLWDLERGAIEKTLEGHSDNVATLAFSPDGARALSSSRDGTSRLWNLKSGESIVLMADGADWLIHDAQGNFDGSRRGGQLVAAVQGRKAFSIEQLAAHNNRPDLILAQIGLASPEVIEHFRARHARRLKKLGLDEAGVAGRFDRAPTATIVSLDQQGKFAEVALELADASALKAFQIWVNGVPVFGGQGKPASGTHAAFRERIELTSGSNRIEVSASNLAGAEALRDFRAVEYKPAAVGDLYYLGFGVSKHQNPRLDLAFAHKDVLDLGKVLEGTSGKFGEVHVRTHVDAEVTTANIRAAKDFLRGAKTDDTVVVFVAGHGTHSDDAAADYFFVTHDVDLARLRETAAPFELIEDLLQDIAPRRKLLLMDTCESGERDEGEAAPALVQPGARALRSRGIRGVKLAGTAAASSESARRDLRRILDVRDRYIYNDLGRRTGAVVFSSSRGSELSYEQDALQNGVFTAQLKAGLTNPAADRDRDGLLSSDELRDFVAAEVARLTNDLQHPTIDRDNTEIRLGLPLSDPSLVLLPRGAREAIGRLADPRCSAEESCKQLQTGCNQGSQLACSTMGHLYALGSRGLPVDKPRALRIYEAICDATAGKAVLECVSAADLYWKGEGVARDAARAMPLARRSCALPGGSMACSRVHQHGDKKFALASLRAGCAAVDASGCSMLLFLLLDAKKVDEAIAAGKKLEAAASGGEAVASVIWKSTRDHLVKKCAEGKDGPSLCGVACGLGDAGSCSRKGLAQSR